MLKTNLLCPLSFYCLTPLIYPRNTADFVSPDFNIGGKTITCLSLTWLAGIINTGLTKRQVNLGHYSRLCYTQLGIRQRFYDGKRRLEIFCASRSKYFRTLLSEKLWLYLGSLNA